MSQLRQAVIEVLERNRCFQERGWQGTHRLFTYHAPSLYAERACHPWLRVPWRWFRPIGRGHYPHQWFWDSCFHAIVLSHLDTGLAQDEIEGLLYAQQEDGFIPQIIWNRPRMPLIEKAFSLWLYPSPHFSPYLQPPLLAEAVEAVYSRGGGPDFMARVTPSLKKYYLYLERTRSPGGDGLLEIISSYESGKDRSPEYDEIYGESNARPTWRGPMFKLILKHRRLRWDVGRILGSNLFRVKDLLFNCIYAKNLFAMGRLFSILGKGEEATYFISRGKATEDAILAKMYNKKTGLFFSLDSREDKDRQIEVNSVSTFMPLLLESIGQKQVENLVDNYLLNPDEFWLDYPVPAVAGGSWGKGDIIWRGQQTWMYTNWYVVRGLCQQAKRFPELGTRYLSIAREITGKSVELVTGEGFREFYDSRGGRGRRSRDFSGSTLVLDMVSMVERSERVAKPGGNTDGPV